MVIVDGDQRQGKGELASHGEAERSKSIMNQCSMDVIACGMQDIVTAWFSLQGPLAWLVNGLIGIAAVVSALSCWQWIREEWHAGKERQAREEAWRRQEKLLDYQTESLIRESEEWCVDTSELKQHWVEQKQVIRWREQSQWFQSVALFPLCAFMLCAIGSLPFAGLRQLPLFTALFSIFAVGAMVWCAWCHVETYRRLQWIKRQARLMAARRAS